MLLINVDNVLVVSHDPKPSMDIIATMYYLKDNNVGPPDRYLGATITSHQHASKVWSMSAKSYISIAVSKAKEDCGSVPKFLTCYHQGTTLSAMSLLNCHRLNRVTTNSS
jgi:hypothetical protein